MRTWNRLGTARGTRLRFLALAVAAVMITPAALAWACGPEARVVPNKSSFAPGESGTITGVNFTPGLSFCVGMEGGGSLACVTIPSSGSFTVGFTAPQTPGSHVVVAQGTDANGNALRSAPATITVTAPPPASSPAPGAGSSSPNGQPASADQTAQAESGAGAAAGAPATTSAPTRSTKGTKTGRNAGRAAPTRTGNEIANSRRGGATAPNVVQPTGQSAPVFAGSAPLSTTPTFSTGAAPAAARTESSSRRGARGTGPAGTPDRPTPSESTAEAATWGGMGSSSDPALVPTGQFPDSANSVNTTARTLSLVLLALGLSGLVGGIAVSERRRRRAL